MSAQPHFEPGSEAWKQQHREYIGGTGAAAIVGMNKYKSPHKLYMEIVHGEFDNAGIKADMGTALEPLVRSIYEKTSGNIVTPAGLIRNPGKPYLGVNPDGFVGDKGGFEAKTYDFATDHEWGEEGEPQNDRQSFIPDPYFVQCIWGCEITERDFWDVMALHRTTGHTRMYRLYRDKDLGQTILKHVEKFWFDHIVAKKPPSLSGHASDLEYVKKQFPTDKGGLCIATPAIEKIVDNLKAAYLKKKEAVHEFDTAKVMLQEFMGENSLMETMAGSFTWRKAKDSMGVDHKSVAAGIMSYASLQVPADIMALLNAERDRLVTTCTGVTKKGSRRFLTPFGDED